MKNYKKNNVETKEKITETYESNIALNTLYDVLDGLCSKYKHRYPNDINVDIQNILNKINNYIYHGHDGYDVIDEKHFDEFTFIKN